MNKPLVKPECRIICNQENDNDNSIYTIVDEVAKCLIKAKRDYGARNYISNINGVDNLEEVLKLSLDYVDFCFVYLNEEE